MTLQFGARLLNFLEMTSCRLMTTSVCHRLVVLGGVLGLILDIKDRSERNHMLPLSEVSESLKYFKSLGPPTGIFINSKLFRRLQEMFQSCQFMEIALYIYWCQLCCHFRDIRRHFMVPWYKTILVLSRTCHLSGVTCHLLVFKCHRRDNPQVHSGIPPCF